MSSDIRDELDRLYEKIEWENPRANFTGRVVARVRWAKRAQRVSTTVTLIALALLGVFGFALGRGLTFSGALDYFTLVVNNVDLISSAADDFIAALGDVMPWTEILAVTLSIALIWTASALLPRWLVRYRSRHNEYSANNYSQ